jgi:uncharacterized protein (DUF58 family)
MMKPIRRVINWLETHAAAPAYSGWVLVGLSICFFGAAINTMAGWLYAISGISFALLGIGAFVAPRSLVGLTVQRRPIQPVTVGDELSLELEITNHQKQPVSLLQVQDTLPFVLGKPVKQAIETILPQETYHWVYYHPTPRRGVYRWHNVELATGAPLGLFWCRRSQNVPAKVIVYPTVLPLTNCPLVDEMGQEDSLRGDPRGRPFQTATEGLTRSLRPYRVGDPTRLIHWRTSARYGELRVRELEIVTGGQEIIIALDSAGEWGEDNFEQAVIAAASLYLYAHHQQMNVKLWTASTGLVYGDYVVLETLAATNAGEDSNAEKAPAYPTVWLTQNPLSLTSLPLGSRWILWQANTSSQPEAVVNRNYPGITIQAEQDLQLQLQKPIR